MDIDTLLLLQVIGMECRCFLFKWIILYHYLTGEHRYDVWREWRL